jgi:hypothetical protein
MARLGRPVRTSWLPCVVCGDPEGYRHPGRACSPHRVSLARFGIEGEGCYHCYQRLNGRHRRGAPIAPEVRRLPQNVPRKTSWPPCAVCGAPGGRVEDGRPAPRRANLERFGIAGAGCHSCHNRLRKRQQKGLPLAPGVRSLTLKTSWSPCVLCGDPDGPVGKGYATPRRVSLRRFGVEGPGCIRCYIRLKTRIRTGLPASPEILSLPAHRAKRTRGASIPAQRQSDH